MEANIDVVENKFPAFFIAGGNGGLNERISVVAPYLVEQVTYLVITYGQTKMIYLLNNLDYPMSLKKIIKIILMVQCYVNCELKKKDTQ